MTERVVTYQRAYIPGETSLCARCAARPPEQLPALGPVSHGLHRGSCDGCDWRRAAELDARLRGLDVPKGTPADMLRAIARLRLEVQQAMQAADPGLALELLDDLANWLEAE